jgi:NAD-dependent deacetylase
MSPAAPDNELLLRARALVAAASRMVVLTGAGVSAESGVPTFRGPGGLWREHRAEELATPAAFARDPRLVWEWYAWRRDLVARCRPNAAHLAIARLAIARDAEHGVGSVRIVTQNVDGLHRDAAHEAAGELLRAEAHEARPDLLRVASGPSAVALPLELHGNLFRSRCTRCDARYEGERSSDLVAAELPPRCPRCEGLLRPDVVWFGEALDAGVLEAAASAAAAADLCLVVGTSGVVQPAASLAGLTRDAGGAVIEINPERTPHSDGATVSLRLPATEAVPAIVGDGRMDAQS